MRFAARIRRWLLMVLAAAGLALPLLTLTRFPTPFPDVQLYASIALARHLYGVGVPTITWNSPAAVDHIPFYGPVFFDLCALMFRLTGIRLVSVRLVSLLGGLLYLSGTLAMARRFGASRDRLLLAAVVVLFAPDVNFASSSGSMHLLAIGFEVLALAAFVHGPARETGDVRNGAAAGLCLALAALTTPRTYPFIFAFVAAGLAVAANSRAAAARVRLAAAVVVLAAAMTGWALVSHGSVAAWARYLGYIFAHEDTDIALLPTAVRDLSFHWSGLAIPAAAVVLGGLAAWSIRHGGTIDSVRDDGDRPSRSDALPFLILTGWISLVISSVVFNFTFSTAEYIALPLFAVVAAWPWHAVALDRAPALVLAILLVACETGLLAYRYACIAATWASRDPAPLNAFVARNVPSGSVVVGPEAPYLFAVEGSGSRYRTARAESWADWARWVPLIEPQATTLAQHLRQPAPRDRFLIWRNDDDVPDGYRCALASIVARFDPAPVDSRWPAWIVRASERYPGYPSSTLYRLPPGCPVGYDATR